MLFPIIKIVYYLRKNQFKMALTLKIFDNNREISRLCALDYVPLQVRGGIYPNISTIKLCIIDKLENLIENYVNECRLNGFTDTQAYIDISNRISDLLGVESYSNSFSGVLHDIIESPQLFLIFDRVEYNISEVLDSRTTLDKTFEDAIPQSEVSVYNSYVNSCREENLLSYLELLAEQNT
jgi:hypothetical protein